MTPITKTFVHTFSNGQTCALRFTSDENGVKYDKQIPTPLRFDEIEGEYFKWRQMVADEFTRGLPDTYMEAAIMQFLNKTK